MSNQSSHLVLSNEVRTARNEWHPHRRTGIGVPTFFPGVFPAKQKRKEMMWPVFEGIRGTYQPL
jgi:hypothetical protein